MIEKERILILGAVLKRIGNFDMSSFEGRLILQKTIYLMQAFKLFLGYHFSWYIYGPYSTELASDGFRLDQIYKNIPEGKFKRKEAQDRFSEFLTFLGKRKTDDHWLELLASIHFLTKLYSEKDKNEIIRDVMGKQHYFPRSECECAWDFLEEYHLVKKK